MLTGLALYKPLFVLQLIIGEALFLFRLERRGGFLPRAAVCTGGILAASCLLPVPVQNAWYMSCLFLSLFALTLAALRVCFDEPFENLLLCGIGGYTVQHLAYLINTVLGELLFRDLGVLGGEMGVVIDPYGDAALQVGSLTAIQFAFYLDIYFLIYFAAFRFFDPCLRDNRNLRLGRTNLVWLSALLITADVIFNMVTNYNAGGNRTSLLMELTYNILLCLLVLALFAAQLSQRELKDELSGVRYMLEQEKRQYELSRKNAELLSIKYHDLRHARQRLARLGATPEAVDELDQVLSDYALQAHTGNEVLDVILTEKAALCRDRNIQFQCMADGTGVEFVKPHHLYALLGNALDNAINAAGDAPECERVVSVFVRRQGDMLHLHVENPCNRPVRFRDGLPISPQEDTGLHGYGMLSMRAVAERYDGGLSVGAGDGLFRLDAVLMDTPED